MALSCERLTKVLTYLDLSAPTIHIRSQVASPIVKCARGQTTYQPILGELMAKGLGAAELCLKVATQSQSNCEVRAQFSRLPSLPTQDSAKS